MSVLHREVLQMVYALPEKTLTSLKPLLSELLTHAVLTKDPHANITAMDELDMALFLRAVDSRSKSDAVSFDEALFECGVTLDEIQDSH